MRAVDTNVLVRLLARDHPGQLASAEAFVQAGAWVSLLMLLQPFDFKDFRAEGVGFEPTGTFRHLQFSRLAQSTTLPPLQESGRRSRLAGRVAEFKKNPRGGTLNPYFMLSCRR